MQQVIHETPNIHPIFDDFDRLYCQLSDKSEKPSLIPNVYSPIFSELWDIFITYGHSGSIQYADKDYPKISIKNKQKTVIVCFSGGKDSIAVVKYYLSKGYKVHLFHVKHINQGLPDEHIYAKEIADYLRVPIYFETLKLSGHHDYVEHPMKNMIILNRAIQYGIREGIGTRIATGNYLTSTLEDDNFEFCGGDDIEMWGIYERIIRSVIPRFRVNIPLESLDDT